MENLQLSKNFTLNEMVKSGTATAKHIDNTPNREQIENLSVLCRDILQPIREAWGEPIVVSSGFRCPKLNSAVGGSKTSQHMSGAAADFSAKDKSRNGELFRLIEKLIKEGKIVCRQLIWEYGNKTNPRWIHISCQDSKHDKRINQKLFYYS